MERLQVILSARQAKRRIGSNFFRIVRPWVRRIEAVHSDMLAWLLDPRAGHGLGDAFARHFIDAALQKVRRPIEEPLIGAALRAVLRPVGESFSINDVKAEVGTGEGPIDVLVELESNGLHVVVGIENKIDSPVGPGQLLRYARGLVGRSGGRAVVLVLLTPTECEDELDEGMPGCGFCAVPYGIVVTALEAALVEQRATSGGTGTDFARHYLEILRGDIVPEPQSDEIEQFLKEFYVEGNREAWRHIRRRLPSERDENHVVMAEAICKRLDAEGAGPWQFAIRPDRYVRVFLPRWSDHFGKTERDRVIGLAAEADAVTHYPHVHFRLLADAEDQDDNRWEYTVKLRLDTRVNPQLGASIRDELGPRLSNPQREKNQITPVLDQTRKLPAIVGGQVPDQVVDWFIEQIAPIARLINGHLELE